MNNKIPLNEEEQLKQEQRDIELQSWKWFVCERPANTLVTLSFNTFTTDNYSELHVINTLKAWDAFINRKLLGKHWQQNREQHITYVAFLEKTVNDPHWHLIANVNSEHQERFNVVAPELWTKLRTTRDAQITAIYDVARLFDYVTKEKEATKQIMMSDQFK